MHLNEPAERRELFLPKSDGNWLYALNASEFIELAKDSQLLAAVLIQRSNAILGIEPDEAEIHSWINSLPALAAIINEAGFADQLIILEYCPPSQDKIPTRIDAVICGKNKYGQLNAVFIELKQWADMPMKQDSDPGYLKIKKNGKWFKQRNPRKQVEDYRLHMQSVLTACELPSDFMLFSAYAYLHNAINLSSAKKQILFGNNNNFDEDSRLYTHEFANALVKRMQERVGFGGRDDCYIALQKIRDAAIQHADKLPIREFTSFNERNIIDKFPLILDHDFREKIGILLFLVLPASVMLILIFVWGILSTRS